MKQEFKMTQEEMDDIIAINKNKPPVMKFGNYWSGMDLQEKINNYWETLENKYGFKRLTVERSTKGKLFFLAEPKHIKTEGEKAEDIYLGNALNYLNSDVSGAVGRIVKQLERCGYECEGGRLVNNVAFLALKKMI